MRIKFIKLLMKLLKVNAIELLASQKTKVYTLDDFLDKLENGFDDDIGFDDSNEDDNKTIH